MKTNPSFRLCYESKEQGFILPISVKKGIYRIDLREVIYFEKKLRKIVVVEEKRKRSFYGKFNELEKFLNDEYCRCHNSYIVNMEKVEEMERYTLLMCNGEPLPISQTRYLEVKKQFLDYLRYEEGLLLLK
ncbi:MAG: LytR/AlgR family response regulator transcription factor [Anaerovoracaceae bacterium]|jgi:DNA-binding LytR/AlgR family response regulator